EARAARALPVARVPRGGDRGLGLPRPRRPLRLGGRGRAGDGGPPRARSLHAPPQPDPREGLAGLAARRAAPSPGLGLLAAPDRGWLRLSELRLDGRPAASLYGFRYRDTFSFYQSGFDPAYARDSVGLVTMGLAIRSAIEEGAAEYDLLHGDEAYKFQWARE